MEGRTSLTLAEGMTGMTENVFLNIKNRSKVITATIIIPEGTKANGILIAQGGRFGGWALYVKNGILAYDGEGVGKGGTGTLYIDGQQAGQGRIERTQPGIFSADETADVGIDLATPVVERIGAEHKSKFNGRIPGLVVEVK